MSQYLGLLRKVLCLLVLVMRKQKRSVACPAVSLEQYYSTFYTHNCLVSDVAG